MGTADQIVVSGETLFELIPQRPPMVMIDALLKADENEFETAFTIREDTLFVENHDFSEAGLIENIAQTSAAGFGQRYLSRNEPVPIGFIGAVQKLEILFLPRVGDHIQTNVSLQHKVMNISVVKGIVFNKGRIAAQCEMKLFLQD